MPDRVIHPEHGAVIYKRTPEEVAAMEEKEMIKRLLEKTEELERRIAGLEYREYLRSGGCANI